MFRFPISRIGALAWLSALAPVARIAPRVIPNDNRTPAGTLRNGVLTLRLEATQGDWHPDADSAPGVPMRAFAEPGQAPQIPGPLIRVPQGTEIHASMHNTLDSTLIVHGLGPRGAGDLKTDTIQVAPGATRELRFSAGAPGTYLYWGSTRPGGIGDRIGLDNELSGAFIVDSAGTGPARDRVLVLGEWNREGPRPGGIALATDLLRFTINGKAWPYTERLGYTTGDTVRLRLVNASDLPHPMHLHGFYYRVDSRGDGLHDLHYDAAKAPLVVTERVPPGRTFALSWVPERAGYWLFHCHNNAHILRNQPLDGSALPPEQSLHPHNHALEMMGGLVTGIEVRPRPGAAASANESLTRRRLRLVARVDPAGAGTEADPAFGYELQENGRSSAGAGPLLPGPVILLKRGEPVSITVVNQLTEGTAVHWHGIELDSYMDGVGDFSGHPGRIAPVIVPRDSFEARFTPPRSGTFIYHPHADEERQQRAGMSGALLVVDDPAAFDPAHDRVVLISTPRRDAEQNQVLLNGSLSPDTLQLKSGEHYRFRVINIHVYRPSMIVRLQRDSTALTWRAVAKDGMDLPPERALVGPAVQQLGNGETYDFEFVPQQPGQLKLIVTSGVGALLVSQPIVVR